MLLREGCCGWGDRGLECLVFLKIRGRVVFRTGDCGAADERSPVTPLVSVSVQWVQETGGSPRIKSIFLLFFFSCIV